MQKTWAQIMDEIGKVPPEQSMQDKREFLAHKGMTFEEFATTEEVWEYRKVAFDRVVHSKHRNKLDGDA